jgi:hypothetical protein
MLLESYRRQSFLQFVSACLGKLEALPQVLSQEPEKQEKLSFLTGSKALPGNPYLEALPRHRIREAEPPD